MAELRQRTERAEQRAAVATRMEDELEELREKEAQLAAAEKSIVRFVLKVKSRLDKVCLQAP